jgi:hypothetical protein
MHALVGPILLRPARMDALVLDAEAHPPDIQLGEAVDARRREGYPLVGPDRPRQPIGAEGALENPPRLQTPVIVIKSPDLLGPHREAGRYHDHKFIFYYTVARPHRPKGIGNRALWMECE